MDKNIHEGKDPGGERRYERKRILMEAIVGKKSSKRHGLKGKNTSYSDESRLNMQKD